MDPVTTANLVTVFFGWLLLALSLLALVLELGPFLRRMTGIVLRTPPGIWLSETLGLNSTGGNSTGSKPQSSESTNKVLPLDTKASHVNSRTKKSG